MKSISEVLKKKSPIQVTEAPKKRNKDWEEAAEFGSYVHIEPKMVMHLFKVYGKARVLALKSWLRDAPNIRPQTFYGLVIWKLKQDLKTNPAASHKNNPPSNAQGTS